MIKSNNLIDRAIIHVYNFNSLLHMVKGGRIIEDIEVAEWSRDSSGLDVGDRR
jgi:hypothetical protein